MDLKFAVTQAKTLCWGFMEDVRCAGKRLRLRRKLKKSPEVPYAKIATIYYLLGRIDDMLEECQCLGDTSSEGGIERKNE